MIEGSPFSEGGEAELFKVGANHLAKIYHGRNAVEAAKLAAIRNLRRLAAQIDSLLTLPEELLFYPKTNEIAGYLMRFRDRMTPIGMILTLPGRRNSFPKWDYRHLVSVARNAADLVDQIHALNMVVCDISSQNFLVANDTTLVSVDVDSMQVSVQSQVYITGVYTEEYGAPDLQSSTYNQRRTVDHDAFSLAVLLFQLLLLNHPFAGVVKAPGLNFPPPIGRRIQNGWFVYGTDPPRLRAFHRFRKPSSLQLSPPASAVPFDVLPERLRDAFVQTFRIGHSHPSNRVRPRRWRQLIDDSANELVQCRSISSHFYFSHLHDCPWCAHSARTGIDHFPK